MTARALEVARELCALPREPMLRTRALARQDLHASCSAIRPMPRARKARCAAWAVDMWFVPATQERLRAVFTKR